MRCTTHGLCVDHITFPENPRTNHPCPIVCEYFVAPGKSRQANPRDARRGNFHCVLDSVPRGET